MQHDESCKILCQKTFDTHDVTKLRNAIKDQYRHNWICDNLPAATVTAVDDRLSTSYNQGFLVGKYDKGTYLLNNHVQIMIDYHAMTADEAPPARIVGFVVEPYSVHHVFKAGATWDGVSGDIPPLDTCDLYASTGRSISSTAQRQEVIEGQPVLFTYDIVWKASDTHWASRWDIYLSLDGQVPAKVHWFSILNSLLIVIFLTAMIGMILMRNLYSDIRRYNRVPSEEERAEEREETGWKLVHADVFRPPSTLPMLFCVMAGCGVQIACSSLCTIIFAAAGFLSPANRGSLLIATLLLYVMFSGVSGFVSATVYKTFAGTKYQRCTLLTALLFPGLCFLIFLGLNLVSKSYGSTQAVPFFTMLSLLILWFCISLPLVFLGAYFGFRRPAISFPVVTSNIPRPIPELPWFLNPKFTLMAAGILPFGAVFVEMFFIMSSIWMGQYYYVFGFLFIVFLILLLTCADISMVFCYFQLCAEDYHWWWRSFLSSGSTALYVLMYSGVYFSHLESNMAVTYILFFGYMSVICAGLFMLCGSIGFFSCLWFTRKIYGSIKVD